jgi:hypothetical protein
VHLVKRLLHVLALAAVIACGDGFQPNTDNVLGTYNAQTFTSDSAGTTTDWLAHGAQLQITLAARSVAQGLLVLPDTAGGPILLADLAGTWTLTADTVHLQNSVDTFVRNMAWVATENQLTGDQTFGGTRIRVVLFK